MLMIRRSDAAARALALALSLGLAAVAAGSATAGPVPAGIPKPKPGSESADARFVTAAEYENWRAVARHRAAITAPLLAKYGAWLAFQHDTNGHTFDDLAAFLDANPDWPRRSELLQRAESAIDSGTSRAAVVDWFERNPPTTGTGALAHLDALSALGRSDEAAQLAPHYWVERGFDAQDERAFLRRYGKHLTRADHESRLDRLIWDQHYGSARRMFRRVEPGIAALGAARVALLRRTPGVDGVIARVPDNLRDAPELWYERLRWRRRKGNDDDAREVLYDLAGLRPNPERWALEGRILARRALGEGHYTEAVRLVSGHGLDAGAEFAESEFLAGWIRLSFLEEAGAALDHFAGLYDGVRYPISRARGAYWTGRAAAAQGDADTARNWWSRAADHPATFYGQLAQEELGTPVTQFSFAEPSDPQARERFAANELSRLVRQLHMLGADAQLRPLLLHMSGLASDLEERLLVAELAAAVDRPREAVRAVKRANQIDNVIAAEGYPLVTLPQMDDTPGLEDALVLSVIRQESTFDERAISGAGARGMMQLMPETAQRVADTLDLSYSRARLLSDPDYNIRLGSTYLARMLDRFDGTVPLALAAYNAGPHRVSRWIREFGDPRTDDIDMIDWIETIPFSETRNYVQRVMESVAVYRHLLDETQLAGLNGPRPAHGSAGQ
jgi:soluble lytic murein transglycosylase